MEELGMQKFKGAIDIAHTYAEECTYECLPTPGIQFTHPGVLALDTIAQDGIIGIDIGKEGAQIVHTKLAIRIHKEGQFFASCGKTTHQSRSIALIHSVVHQTNLWGNRGDGVNNRSGAITAAIIDDNNFTLQVP